MKKRFIYLFCWILLLIPCNTWAITVRLEILCDNNNIRSKIISAINTEFRRLGDIHITDKTDADFFISTFVLEQKNVSGYPIGIICSTVVLKHFNNDFFVSILPEDCYQYKSKRVEIPKDASRKDMEFFTKMQKSFDKWDDANKDNIKLLRKEFWKSMTNDLFQLDNHLINTGTMTDIPNICRKIVATIDTGSFQRFRIKS